MCRHLGWLGEPVTLASLILDPPHGLCTQAYAPRMQSHGTINADGWGVAFYPGPSGEPARWRSDRPLWSDASFASVAPTIRSGCFVAAVRSATVGMPADESAAAPFVSGRWSLSHNGVVDRAVLPPSRSAESTCDSALLAAAVFAAGAQNLGRTVAEVGGRDPGARLNVIATDGTTLLATVWGDTLFVHTGPGGTVLASEPFDDADGWQLVPDRSLVRVRGTDVAVTSISADPMVEHPNRNSAESSLREIHP